MFKITIIGESCNDVFIYGDIERLCPEAPVPIFKPKKTQMNKGMLGNIEENIKSIDKNFVIKSYTQKNLITKTRLVEEKSNHMIVRIDEGENFKTENIIFDEHILLDIQNSDIVIVSDYDKGFLSIEDLEKIGKLSNLSILDSKKKLVDNIVSKFTFVKLNEIEFSNNKHLTYTENIITTLGSKGVKYQDKVYPQEFPKETIDVSGAGDTFVAAFIIKFFKTQDIYKSIKFANEMSSIVVTKRGVSTP
jgi:bifunctional ADP-heptose synthase (sugar kinase/adenylyltransferase)